MAFLDGSIVSLALPDIDRDLGAGVVGLQWTVNAYTLTLAALVLVGGSLGDRLGRRRIFIIGVAWFGVASVLCAVAPSIEVLVAARALQGIGGALLTPGSLAIISASIDPADRGGPSACGPASPASRRASARSWADGWSTSSVALDLLDQCAARRRHRRHRAALRTRDEGRAEHASISAAQVSPSRAWRS